MKKFFMVFVCLMTMVINVNAQWYRAGSRAGNRMASYAHSMKLFSIQQNAKYAANRGKINYNKQKVITPQVATGDGVYDVPLTSDEHEYKDPTAWLKNFIILGGGVGGGNISLEGHSNGTFDVDFIAMNVLFSAKLGNLLTIDPNKMDLKDADSFQLGVLIPVFTFDKSEYMFGQKGKIFVAPLIEFVSAEDVNIDGHFFHSGDNAIEGHNCQDWISTTTTEDLSCTAYGGAIMVKYGCGYILGKVTNKSWGISIGLCM